MLRGCAALHRGLGANQGQAVYHPKRRIAGALRQTAARGKNHLHLQTPASGHEGPEIALQQSPGVGREAQLAGGRMDTSALPGINLKPNLL